MIITLREQSVIKEWNKKGLGGLRMSSLELLENIGGKVSGEDSLGVCKVLCRHTVRMMPEGLWSDEADDREVVRGYCEEICFLAGVEFNEAIFLGVCDDELEEREDVEFGDGD